uniref:14-3-3 domain-containing protein n=1 Tax=Arundo donax TaxID=35708 RepID=A0A0A8Y1M7_ARUDO
MEGDDACGYYSAQIKFYKDVVEYEMQRTCQKGITVLEKYLIPSCSAAEQSVMVHKMLGDLCWYQYELTVETNKLSLLDKAVTAYQEACTISQSLCAAHPMKLSVHLNLSALY